MVVDPAALAASVPDKDFPDGIARRNIAGVKGFNPLLPLLLLAALPASADALRCGEYRSLDDGMALVHTIGGNASVVGMEPWLDKYIFPHAVLPSIRQLSHQMEHRFVVEDWHNFGPDYDKTLMAWYENFVRNWPRHKEKYGERFYRMWSYYLLNCAGSFRGRKNQLWQIVLSKYGVPGGYVSVR